MSKLCEAISNAKKVYIQPHNNPDADAIASAWGILKLVESLGKSDTQIVYSGLHIKKPNLDQLITLLDIKMKRIDVDEIKIEDDDLLIVVDGQYGAGNIAQLDAKKVIAIDHHEEETSLDQYVYSDIQPRVGACSTLIFGYLKENNVELDRPTVTALHFGIYMDTDGFVGRMTNLDHDTRFELERSNFDSKAFDRLRTTSLSFDDLWTFAEAIPTVERYHNLAFCMVPECDDNLLGQIADLLLLLVGIDIVVLHSKRRDQGYKLSIRSTHDFLTADRITRELVRDIGNGGGHRDKAGGFIRNDLLQKNEPNVSIGILLRTRLIDYYREVKLLRTGLDDSFSIYGEDRFFNATKKQYYLRYLKISDYFTDRVTMKSLEGREVADPDDLLMVGHKNQIWPIKQEKFKELYELCSDKRVPCLSDSTADGYGCRLQSTTKEERFTPDEIRKFEACWPRDNMTVRAMELDSDVVVRTSWGDLYGKKGDYLIYRSFDDYYICDGEVFHLTYQSVPLHVTTSA